MDTINAVADCGDSLTIDYSWCSSFSGCTKESLHERAAPCRPSSREDQTPFARPRAAHLWKQWVGRSMAGEKTPPWKAGEARPRCRRSTMS